MPETDPLFLRSLPQVARDAVRMPPEATSRGLLLEAITRCDLDDEVLNAEASVLTAILQQLGITSVIYECSDGWMPIPVTRIPEVLTSDVPTEGFTPWVRPYSPMDLTFLSANSPFELEFCHHAQVHVRANDPALLEPFWGRWKENGLAFGRRVDAEWHWEDE
jgi:hypothetical protein